ncbi:MAG: hypothetical protein AAGJ38_01840 [Planctomycetota bacterium]
MTADWPIGVAKNLFLEMAAAVPDVAAATPSRSNEQLQLLVQGWVAIAMLAAVGALGLALIAVLLAVWRRSLQREKRLEAEIREVRSSLTAIGDAWAASATRIPGFAPRNAPEDDESDDDEDEDDEPDDPYNLFGGRDPLDGEDDEEDPEDDAFTDDDEGPPPGFR